MILLLQVNKNFNIEICQTRIYGCKPAIVLRRKMMAKSASIFTKPKGRVINANAIRCSRYRRRLKEKLSPCTYTSLSYLKWSSKYMNSIKMIGMDPFTVSYVTPDQLKLYSAYKKKNVYTKMSGDTTGNVIHKLGK